MKKKFVSILLIPVIAVSLAACGSTNSQRSSSSSEKTAEQAEEAANHDLRIDYRGYIALQALKIAVPTLTSRRLLCNCISPE